MDRKEHHETIQGLSRRMEQQETEGKSETRHKEVKPWKQRVQTEKSR